MENNDQENRQREEHLNQLNQWRSYNEERQSNDNEKIEKEKCTLDKKSARIAITDFENDIEE
jgi:hypothetical protein